MIVFDLHLFELQAVQKIKFQMRATLCKYQLISFLIVHDY
jgi:hypothetical protein